MARNSRLVARASVNHSAPDHLPTCPRCGDLLVRSAVICPACGCRTGLQRVRAFIGKRDPGT